MDIYIEPTWPEDAIERVGGNRRMSPVKQLEVLGPPPTILVVMNGQKEIYRRVRHQAPDGAAGGPSAST